MHNEITRILTNICRMQKEAVREEIQDEYCTGRLGCGGPKGPKFNTRPVEIYTDDDRAWECPIDRNSHCCVVGDTDRTCALRVERVENGAVTFRALKPHGTDCAHGNKYDQTDSFITIKLENIAAVRCMKDTFVNLCIR